MTGPSPVHVRSLQYIDWEKLAALYRFYLLAAARCPNSYIYTEDVFVKVLSSAILVGGGWERNFLALQESMQKKLNASTTGH